MKYILLRNDNSKRMIEMQVLQICDSQSEIIDEKNTVLTICDEESEDFKVYQKSLKMNDIQKAQSVRILGCYGETPESLIEKSLENELEKGGKRALIGEKRTFAGREYIKTADGWKFHGKGTGEKAQAHVAGTTKVEEKMTEEKKLDTESIPTSEDGLYQIYTTKIKNTNTGLIKEMYVVPSASNKGQKGMGSDLFDSLDEAIQAAKDNRLEQKEDEEREAQRLEEKKVEEAAKEAKKEANKGKSASQIMQEAKKEKVWSDWKLDVETRMKAGYKPEVAEVFDSAATNKRQERYDYLRKYAPFGNPKHPQTIEMQQLKEDIANGSIKKKETRLVHPDGRFFKIPQSVYDRLTKED